MDRGMVEVRQRRVEAADRATKAFEQRGRARAHFGQRDALEIGDEAHEMGAARRDADRVAGDGWAARADTTPRARATCAIAAFCASSVARSSVAFAILSTSEAAPAPSPV